ncbi:MAG: two-component regulator propeller domain-containing protein [Acidobacteriota bacterium]
MSMDGIAGRCRPLLSALVLALAPAAVSVDAGHLPLVHYTVEHGLPSSVAYWITQDRDGFVWFATDSGLARFDGRRFESFTTADGLPTNFILTMEEDHQGRLWCLPFRARPFLLEPDGPVVTPLATEGAERVVMNRVFFDSRGRTWLTGLQTHRVDPDGTAHRLDVEEKTNAVYEDVDGAAWTMTPLGFVRLTGTPARLPLTEWSPAPLRPRFLWSPTELVYQDSAGLVRKTPEGSRRLRIEGLPDAQHNRLYRDSHGDVWIGSTQGLYRLKGPAPWSSPAEELLPGRLITCIHEDREQNLWIATRNDGVWLLPRNARAFTQLDTRDGLPHGAATALGRAGDSILVGCHTGDLFALPASGDPEPVAIGHVDSGSIRALTPVPSSSDERSMLIVADLALHLLQDGELSLLLKGAIKDTCFEAPGSLLVASGEGVHRVRFGQVGPVRDIGELVFDDRCYAVELDETTIWLGTTQGLYRLPRGGRPDAVAEAVLTENIVDLAWAGDRLCACSTDQGVFLLGDQVVHLTEKDGLASNSCRRLHVDEEGAVWIATTSGLDRFHPDAPHDLSHYSRRDGLASDDVNDILRVNGRVHAATFRGVSIFDPTELRSALVAPLLHLRRVTIDGREVPLATEHELPHGHGPVGIELAAPAFDGADGGLRYEHRFAGTKVTWQALQEPSMTLSRLGPGRHVLEVRALDEHDVASDTVSIVFDVATAWWATWWFQLTSLLGVAAIAAAVVRQRNRRVALTNRLAALQGQALQLQMNPHFIFNSMNALQGLIAKGERQQANRHVASLGLLMRKILTNSRESQVSLGEVVETLSLYLELNQRRFQDRLRWQLRVDEELDRGSVQLPPMLVQPLVENAIEHGLASRGGRGEVRITFTIEASRLVIEVTDDGVGRSPRRDGHRSAGLAITRERLALISGGEGRLDIEDLQDEAGEPRGTRVRLAFPLRHDRETIGNDHD